MVNLSKFIHIQIPHFFIYRNIPHLGSIFFFFHYSYHRLINLLIHMSNFVSIRYYLPYDLYSYILHIILNYKKLQFKQFINDIAIDL